MGDIPTTTIDGKGNLFPLLIQDVTVVSDLSHNLLSVYQLYQRGVTLDFGTGTLVGHYMTTPLVRHLNGIL